MENVRQYLVTEPQIKKIQAMLSNLYDKNKVEEMRDKIKVKYAIPSFWQLSREEASAIIETLLEVEAKREANQPKLL